MNQRMLVLERTEGREEESGMTLPGGNECRRFVCVHKGQFQTACHFSEEVITEGLGFVQTNSKILSSGFNF